MYWNFIQDATAYLDMARTDLWHRMTFLLPVTEMTTSLKHPCREHSGLLGYNKNTIKSTFDKPYSMISRIWPLWAVFLMEEAIMGSSTD